MKVFPIKCYSFLPGHEGEAFAQFQQKMLQLVYSAAPALVCAVCQ
jgi:hypothetical protein